MSRAILAMNCVSVGPACAALWDDMAGDDQVRFCPCCQLPVYDISHMSVYEAQQLARQGDGRLRVRVHPSREGCLLTLEHPTGVPVSRWKQVLTAYALAEFGLVLFLVTILALLTDSPPVQDGRVDWRHFELTRPLVKGIDSLRERVGSWR